MGTLIFLAAVAYFGYGLWYIFETNAKDSWIKDADLQEFMTIWLTWTSIKGKEKEYFDFDNSEDKGSS